MSAPATIRRGACPAGLLLMLLALLAPAAVHAEIFKCVAKDGSPLYQNFPCNVDSLGSVPATAVAAVTPPVMPVKAASPPPVVVPSPLRRGLSEEQVVALLGEPVERIEDEPATGRVSTWRYADGSIARFDHKHRLLEVQRRH